MIAPRTRVLVTGAAGFVGAHLVARLAGHGVDVRAILRSGIATLPGDHGQVRRFRGDVTDGASLREAVEGCEVVFHCAWGGTSLDEARRINVQGTRNVIECAAGAGVRRVVHISSMAVHGPDMPSILTEECPLQPRGSTYAVSKAEGERAALEAGAAHGVEIVALRPTRVYGPGAPLWLIGYFERCRVEELALVDGGRGLVNLIHVEDLIDVMLIAAKRREGAGEAFLVSGPEPATWREYIGYFATMLRKPLPPSVPLWRARAEVLWSRAYSALTQRRPRLRPADLERMTQLTSVSIRKAGHLLGWKPRLSLEQGMELCADWLRKEGYLPPERRQAADRAAPVEPAAVG